MYRKFMMATCKNFAKSKVKNPITTTKMDYEACIDALNGLQSNAQYIRNHAKPLSSHNASQLADVQKYLIRSGLSFESLDKLQVIHVAGTKGKGTTCAFAERILREHGYKTGFYSSPHLIEVRERIRINGVPISRADFAEYFSQIFSQLDQHKDDEHDMPLYFRFLTIMSFMIFVEKKVDVAIIEVGIGGEFDCTNVLRKVPVIGITSLGIDHTNLLGSTIESIAWNKAGIMKSGGRAFSVPQPEAAMAVLRERSIEKQCQLTIIDSSVNFKTDRCQQIPDQIFNVNASLAVALCEAWLRQKDNNNRCLSKDLVQLALDKCQWPGRFDVKQEKKLRFFLDGAHTIESIELCADWFSSVTRHSPRKKALLFNLTGNRNARQFLQLLQKCQFDAALFVTNQVGYRDKEENKDFVPMADVLAKCKQNRDIWLEITGGSSVRVFPNVIAAINFLHTTDEFDVLTTGSLHLVGAVLTIIEPDLNDK